MPKLRAGLLCCLAALILTGPAVAQDQRFAFRFGLNMVEPTGDSTVNGVLKEFDTQGGLEVDFEWYFHPRVGFEVAATGSGDVDYEDDRNRVAGATFSTFTLGINGHLVRSEKVDFAVGILAGNARYADFEIRHSTVTFDAERDTTLGVQAFVDMTVGRKWAVNLGLKYLDTQLKLSNGTQLDYNPVILRVMGVFRWGRHK